MTTDPPLRCEQVIPTVAVGDLAAALDFYTGKLGFREDWSWGDPPVHAGLHLGDAEIHLSGSEPNPGGSWLYFVVDDVDALYELYRERGVEIVHPPAGQEWDMREMPVRDPVGNEMTFASARIAREPKLVIEREALNVRVEKRIAAVLRDLAEHKGMSLTELLEETLLHTFEPWRDGVASPHTRADLRRIRALKEKHGIDYDVHASYRFVEERAEPDTRD